MTTFLAFFPDENSARQATREMKQPTVVSYITTYSNQHFDGSEGFYPNLTPYLKIPLKNTDNSLSTIDHTAHSLFAITGSDSLYHSASITQRLTDYGLTGNDISESLDLITLGYTAVYIETPDKEKGPEILKKHGAHKITTLTQESHA